MGKWLVSANVVNTWSRDAFVCRLCVATSVFPIRTKINTLGLLSIAIRLYGQWRGLFRLHVVFLQVQIGYDNKVI